MHHWSQDRGGLPSEGVSGQVGVGGWLAWLGEADPLFPQMATAVVGTHPTEMHSRLRFPLLPKV